MFRFILRRLLSGIVLLFVISTIAYSLLYVGGGDIARRILGQMATEGVSPRRPRPSGSTAPSPCNTSTGSATRSAATWARPGSPASSSRSASRPGSASPSLVIGAILVTAIVAVVLGVWAAVHGGWADKVVQAVSILGFAIPGFLVALGLVTLFALNLKWFKPTGYVPLTESPSGWLATVTLPIIALAIGSIAGVAQQVRGSVTDALRQDYVRTLRSRGLSFNRVVYKHVLRNAGGPALAVLAVQFVGLLGGAVIVEQIFAIPGLGQVAVTATTQGDIPMVMGLVVATAIIVVVVNLLIDLLQGWLNPKVRLS
ncbi:ABC transporter permease [Cryobacterium sp. 10C3]|uniref:ABC transporter permease n=1 Tax=Cryobacterium sp. 10C3 TaxID=3048577 RepID=UPI002AB55836|nr:ABC transporter permease [Cryobacterium sp. 10C3]MDY7557640.1 ABC transporter permease [Cryobacterium sp. 10C3]